MSARDFTVVGEEFNILCVFIKDPLSVEYSNPLKQHLTLKSQNPYWEERLRDDMHGEGGGVELYAFSFVICSE